MMGQLGRDELNKTGYEVAGVDDITQPGNNCICSSENKKYKKYFFFLVVW
jgi:hypothetical protein